MFLPNWISGLKRQILNSHTRKMRKVKRTRLGKVEQLEDRTVPTATLYIDYGDNFPKEEPSAPTGILKTTIGTLAKSANADGPHSEILGPSLVDDDGNRTPSIPLHIVPTLFTTEQRAQMLDVIRRIYLPFDVHVVELTSSPQFVDGRIVVGAKNMTDVVDTLRLAPVDTKDSYILVGNFIVAPGTAQMKPHVAGGQAMLDSVSNSRDDVGGVFTTDTSLVGVRNAIVSIAHEAGHTFGLNHAADWVGTDATNYLHSSEIMAYSNTNTSPIFSRYPMLRGNSNTPLYSGSDLIFNAASRTIKHPEDKPPFKDFLAGMSIKIGGTASNNGTYEIFKANGSTLTLKPGTVLTNETASSGVIWSLNSVNYNDLAALNGHITIYDQLSKGAGLKNSDINYVSGTGAHDIITITPGGGEAYVTIQAFADEAYTMAIPVPGQGGTTYRYSFPLNKPIYVFGGDSNDRIVINGDLGVDVNIEGMWGVDELVINGNRSASSLAHYVPSEQTTTTAFDGSLDLRGSITTGRSIISYAGFEPESRVTIKDFGTVQVDTSSNATLADRVEIHRESNGEKISGTNAGQEFVPLLLERIRKVNLNTSGGPDTVELHSFNTATEWMVNGGSGEDELLVSPESKNLDWLDVNSRVRFTFDGGTGAGDKITITNSKASQRTSYFFLKPEDGPPSGIYVKSIGWLTGYNSVESIQFDGSQVESDTFDIHHVPKGTSLAVNGDGGNDHFLVGNGVYDLNIRDRLTIDGGYGSDDLIIDDSLNKPLLGSIDSYRLGSELNSGLIFGTFQKGRLAPIFAPLPDVYGEKLLHHGVEKVTLEGSLSPDRFHVDYASRLVKFTLNGNDGEDVFNIGKRDFDSSIFGTVIVNGGHDKDTLNIDDQDDSLSGDYTIAANAFTKSTTTGRVEYSSISTFNFDANNLDNTIEVLSTSAFLKIDAHGGDDTILLSPIDKNLDFLRGAVSVIGNDGFDTVVLNDRDSLMNGRRSTLPYYLSPGLVRKEYVSLPEVSYGKFPGLSYIEIEDLTLHAADGANVISVTDTTPGVGLSLFGNGGADRFVFAVPPSSNVYVSGGVPATSPGDSLLVVGTASSSALFTPGASGAGRIDIAEQTIDFTGIEQPVELSTFSKLRVKLDNRHDDLWIREDGGGYSHISERSNPSAGPPLLQFRRVADVVLEGSSIDVNSIWTLEAGALNALSLASLELLTGSGQTIVNDHTLEGPVTPARLLLNNLEGGNTQHRVSGAADSLTVASFEDGPKFAHVAAGGTNGDIAYVFEDEGVNDLLFLDPQKNVHLYLYAENAQFQNVGNQLNVTGAGLTQIRIPSTPDGRLRVQPEKNMTIEIESTVFPEFQFDPIYGMELSPIGTFHVRPVFSTADSGHGTLRQAIAQANSAPSEGKAVVYFGLEAGHSGVEQEDIDGDGNPDVFVISPLTALPALTRGNTIINGDSQQARTGDTNSFGPEIVLSGKRATGSEVFEGLVSQYRFEGSVADYTGTNEPFAASGISFTDGRLGEGVTFAPGGYIDIPHSDSLALSTFTLAAWVRPDGPGPNDDELGSSIVQKGITNLNTSVGLWWSSQSQKFIVGSGNVFNELNRSMSTDSFAPGRFYHVAATFDGATFNLYVDGMLQGSHVRNSAIPYEPMVPWTIGSTAEIFRIRPGQPNYPRTWNGVIDEVGIYNRALSNDEIQSLAFPVGTNEAGLTLASSNNHVHGLNIQQFSGNGVLIAGTAFTGTNGLVDKNEFLSATGAESVAPFEDQGTGSLSSYTTTDGLVTLLQAAPASPFFIQSNITSRIEGPTIGINDREHLDIQLAQSAYAFGFDFVEPQFDPNVNAEFVDSTFRVTLKLGGQIVSSFDFNAPNDEGSFVGATSSQPFDRIEIREVDGGIDNEFFGRMYLSTSPSSAYSNTLTGNFIGTNARGDASAGNDINGVQIVGSTGNTIGGRTSSARNVISGNATYGVMISGGWDNRLEGNYIGTTADGKSALGNTHLGIWVLSSSGNSIGGGEPGSRNVISGNGYDGISIGGGGDNLVQNNLIGTDVSGTVELGNGNSGISLNVTTNNTIADNVISSNVEGVSVQGGSRSTNMTNLIVGNKIGTDITGSQDFGNTSGGVTVLNGIGTIIRGNVISGTDFRSNVLINTGSSGVIVESNLIGTDSTGNARLPNPQGFGATGVTIFSQNNIVRDNVISANPAGGIVIDNGLGYEELAHRNTIQGNLIGVGRDGVTPLGNSIGVFIRRGANNNLIGTTGDDPKRAKDGNVIAFNTGPGVLVRDDTTLGNTIRGNSMHSNGGLGIDLGATGITPNDALDADGGSNLLQNFPELSSVKEGATTKIVGKLKSTPNSAFVVDFYVSTAADPSGHGEGQRWLGSTRLVNAGVVTNGNGTASFNVLLPVATAPGEYITATATDASGNTSEFSEAIRIKTKGGLGGGDKKKLIAAESPVGVTDKTRLKKKEVMPLLAEALAFWGIDEKRIKIRITNLPGLTLAQASKNTIWLDRSAAGWGWFVDATPADDGEFRLAGDQGEQNRIDLLSVLIHEVGHLIGRKHELNGAMQATLSAGVREHSAIEKVPMFDAKLIPEPPTANELRTSARL